MCFVAIKSHEPSCWPLASALSLLISSRPSVDLHPLISMR
jgi:hypothetical protein